MTPRCSSRLRGKYGTSLAARLLAKAAKKGGSHE